MSSETKSTYTPLKTDANFLLVRVSYRLVFESVEGSAATEKEMLLQLHQLTDRVVNTFGGSAKYCFLGRLACFSFNFSPKELHPLAVVVDVKNPDDAWEDIRLTLGQLGKTLGIN
jgi:hypothetical protein